MRGMRFIHFHLAFMVFAEFHQYTTAESFIALSSAQAFNKPSKLPFDFVHLKIKRMLFTCNDRISVIFLTIPLVIKG
jgi:hypothetical protein